MIVLQYALLGLGAGAIYALAAQGIVLVYRGSGVVNFAQGGYAMVGAFAYYEAIGAGWPRGIAAPAGVLVAAVAGALTNLLVMRRLTTASPLTRVVATLGILSLLSGIAIEVYGADQRYTAALLPQGPVGWIRDIFGPDVVVGADRLWLLLIGVLIAAAGWAVYKYTRFGLTTRAVAERPLAAASLGRSPDVIATVNWAAGAGLGGLAGVLLIQITGLSVLQFNMLLLPALAAALVGGFTSFPITWLAGVALGIAETLLLSNASWLPEFVKQPGWSDAVPLVVILGLLVLTGRALPLRSYVIERQPQAGSGQVRWGLIVPAVVAFVVLINGLAMLGYGGIDVDWVDAAIFTTANAIVALSLVVVTGYAGQVSLAQFTFAGLGAFIAARLAAGAPLLGIDFGGGLPFPLALLAATAVAVPAGLLLGLPALRTRGVNLAIATMGFAVIVEGLIFENPGYTGGIQGTMVDPPSLFGLDLDSLTHPRRYATLCLVALAVLGLMVANLRRSASGRRLLAVRSNERAAAALGISVTGAKLYAFGLAAAIAAVGGVLLAFRQTPVTFDGYDVFASINLVVSMVVGGIGYIGSSVLAGAAAGGGAMPLLFSTLIGPQAVFIVSLIMAGALPFILIKNPSGILQQMASVGRRLDRLRLLRAFAGSRNESLVQAPIERVSPKALRIQAISVRFGSVTAVSDVSLHVEPGTVVGLIGPNGAGKSTLIDVATGFTARDAGTVTLNGASIDRWSARRRARHGLGRSFQSLELFDELSVCDHLRIASERRPWWGQFRDLVWSADRPLAPSAVAAIHEFNLAADLARKPVELPHGRRRLLAIARALAARPSVLLLDEPAAGLDADERTELGEMIRRVARDWGVAVLLVEHDVELVMSVCDRVAVLDFGKKIAEGTPEEVCKMPGVLAAYLGEDDQQREPPTHAAKPAVLATAVAPPKHSSNGRTSQPLLAARSLCAGYGGASAVRDLDLEVHPGEVVAMLGANGAGKTTSLLTLAGALPASGGDVCWRGKVVRASMDWRARNGLVLVPGERSVFMDLTVAENLRVADGDPAVALELFPELSDHLHRKAGLLSGGQQQMLALGRALACRPSVLLADELSLGLAPIVVKRLLEAVRAAADAGTGVLLVEQHARAALEIADRAYVLRRGEVVLQGAAEDIAARRADLLDTYLAGEASLTSASTVDADRYDTESS